LEADAMEGRLHKNPKRKKRREERERKMCSEAHTFLAVHFGRQGMARMTPRQRCACLPISLCGSKRRLGERGCGQAVRSRLPNSAVELRLLT
jgi:hypothetical protein